MTVVSGIRTRHYRTMSGLYSEMSLVRPNVFTGELAGAIGELVLDSKNLSSAENHLRIIMKVLDTILTSREPSDLCRQIVHGDYVPESTVGASIFYLDGASLLRPVASYGKNPVWPNSFSAWDYHPPSESVRKRVITAGPMTSDDLELMVVALPLISNNMPCGAMVLALEDLSFKIEIVDEVLDLYFKLGAFYLESLNLGNLARSASSNPTTTEDLTSRQLTILAHMSNEHVNHEIAKILMLSESTIRQDTVRIYRTLGVGNRQDAVKKARSLGLIPNLPTVYPPPA